jgi:hypothetical protein
VADIWTIPTRYSICHTARLLARRGKGQSLGCRFTCQCTTFPTTLRTQYRSEACLILGDSSDYISSISMIYHNRADPHPVGRTVERSDSPTKYKSTEGALVQGTSSPHVTATSWAPHDCGASTLRGYEVVVGQYFVYHVMWGLVAQGRSGMTRKPCGLSLFVLHWLRSC